MVNFRNPEAQEFSVIMLKILKFQMKSLDIIYWQIDLKRVILYLHGQTLLIKIIMNYYQILVIWLIVHLISFIKIIINQFHKYS